MGLEPTGTLDVGQVVVVPGLVRINSVTAQLGDPVAEDLMTVTSTTKTVMFNAQAADIGGIRAGADVTIVRPDNQRVPGKVTAIGATVPKDGEGTDGSPSFSVTVAPKDARQLDGLDFAAVQIEVVTERRTGVLAVPVSALVALREGGYALQLPNGRYVAARTGMFSRSLVEVGGDGIANGLEVVTVP